MRFALSLCAPCVVARTQSRSGRQPTFQPWPSRALARGPDPTRPASRLLLATLDSVPPRDPSSLTHESVVPCRRASICNWRQHAVLGYGQREAFEQNATLVVRKLDWDYGETASLRLR